MATKVASRSVTTAIAIAGRASRACDVCANRSARWYCGADAAYLCDRCDTQVHSANSLAKRHERVRLTSSGVPMKSSRKVKVTMADHDEDSEMPRKQSSLKKCHSAPVQVMSSRKRSRTSRAHPLKRRASEAKPSSKVSKVEDVKVKEELLTFSDIFDTEDFLVDDTQEVPAFITVAQDSSPSSSEFDLSSPELSPEFRSDFYGVSSPSEDSFAAYFKSKAAHNDFSDDVMTDQFLVPDGVFDNCLDSGVNICCDVDSSVSLAGDACFIPGDIPGLDGFEDDYSLSFHLALRDASPDAFGGDSAATVNATEVHPTSNAASVEADQFGNGPFAKFFATKPKGEKVHLSPENIKSEAKEILRCSLEGLSEEDLRTVPTLRLNYEDVLTAWSDRGEPWVNPENSTDVGLVPDMGQGGADDDQTGGGREARVLRYKEKRRSRLFSKTIRYAVRKLNAERRPRMKGRFVKRT